MCKSRINDRANFLEESKSHESIFYACHSANEEKGDIWFLDSGCTNNMTGNRELFHHIDTSYETKVRMGNDSIVQAKGKGSIVVQTKMGQKFIRDVLMVPDLKQNLLSVGQLVKNGYAVYFEDGGCKIFDRRNKNQIIARIQMEKSRSFPLRISYASHLALRNEVIKPQVQGGIQCQDESRSRTSSLGLRPSANPRDRKYSTISASSPKQARNLPKIYESSNFSFIEPQSFEEARKHENLKKATKDKIHKIEKNNSRKLVDRPNDHQVISDKYIYKTKLNPGKVKNYKIRLMTKGFEQEPGINYWKTYAPIRRLEKWQSYQPNVKSALQNNYLDKENYYVKEPLEISNQGGVNGGYGKSIGKIKL